MSTNRIHRKLLPVLLALFASVAGAQTIYKQVDPEGRVMFTDRPNPEARVVASYETSRPARRADTESEGTAAEPAVVEAVRRSDPGAGPRPGAPASVSTSSMPRGVAADTPYAPMAIATSSTARSVTPAALDAPVAVMPSTSGARSDASETGTAAGATPSPREAERAASTYTSLQSASALQVDANESARRARQDMQTQKDAAAGVLIVKPEPRERDPAPRYEGFTVFYVMWAATFFLLAAGLLYVGWQIFRLILRSAFPRWQLGIG